MMRQACRQVGMVGGAGAAQLGHGPQLVLAAGGSTNNSQCLMCNLVYGNRTQSPQTIPHKVVLLQPSHLLQLATVFFRQRETSCSNHS